MLFNLYFPVKYFGDHCLSTVFLSFSFGYCIVCSYSIGEIKKSLQATCTKTDLESAVNCLVKQSDLNDLVTSIVNKLLVTFKKSFSQEIESKVKEQTGKMQDQIDSFAIENENLKERLRDKDKKMDSLEEKLNDADRRSVDALKLGNHNEQYSRKHNISHKS
jgi:predicted RNase H-like nuclease (RuvC/YqgF family)